MALINKKLTDRDEIAIVPDNAIIHVVLPDDISQSPEGSSYKAGKRTIISLKQKYNATTNTPNLENGTGGHGDMYQVSVEGERDFGAGNIRLEVGDIIAYSADDGIWFLFANNNQTSELGEVAFSNDYNDLDNIPTINNYFKGKFTSLANLQAAFPTATDGDYAIVDAGMGIDALEYIWDANEGWVKGNSQGATTTDVLPEGSSNLYFTTARVLATLLTGISFATGGAIVSTDSVLVAFGKIQKQITDALTAIGLKQDTLVSGNNIKTVNGVTILGSGDLVTDDTILQKLGVSVKFNQASASAYPFAGGQLNSGTLQGSLTTLITPYSNAFVRFIAASGVANSGYRFSDGNSHPITFLKGTTFFGIVNPIVTTNLSAILGMPHAASISGITENTTIGAWFNITGATIQAKCANASSVSTGTSQAITATEWLLCMIEIIDNDAVNKRIRFKVRKTDGTIVYNEDITTNIPAYNSGSTNNSTGVRAILAATPGGNTDIFGLQVMEFWAEKPNKLRYF